jgi:hypothetical protein
MTHSTAPHSTAPYSTAPHSPVPHNTAPHSTAPHSTVPHGTAPHSTALTLTLALTRTLALTPTPTLITATATATATPTTTRTAPTAIPTTCAVLTAMHACRLFQHLAQTFFESEGFKEVCAEVHKAEEQQFPEGGTMQGGQVVQSVNGTVTGNLPLQQVWHVTFTMILPPTTVPTAHMPAPTALAACMPASTAPAACM